ncbi:hypothetical protein DICA2_B15214 [Diutina catenulata]
MEVMPVVSSSKRARVDAACDRCRSRKSKCDGKKPACSSCNQRQVECVYGKRYTRSHMSEDYVRQLEERLGIDRKAVNDSHDEEQSDRESEPPSRHTSVSRTPPTQVKRPSFNSGDAISATMQRSQSQPNNSHSLSVDNFDHTGMLVSSSEAVVHHVNNSSPPVVNSSRSSVAFESHVMGAGGSSKHNYYGKSAAVSFMNELSAIIDATEGTNPAPREDPESMVYTMAHGEDELQNVVLPPFAVANKYVDDYFTYAWNLYPFVHKPTFFATYKLIWGTSDVQNKLFYCILNLTMAIGCLLSPTTPSAEKEASSDLYFERSQQLLPVDLLDGGNLMTVQALLLTGQYLQATPRSAGCWNYIGLAIRMAQGLGLHEEDNKPQSCIYREMKRRIWHGCVMMDRIVSMTFGRPLMVSEWSIPKWEPVDDECITDDKVVRPVSHTSELSFFEHTLKLYKITGQVLQTFFSGKGADVLTQVLEFEKKMNAYRRQVPWHINYDNKEIAPKFLRQTNVLYLRYLHLKLSVYRNCLFPHSADNDLYEVTTAAIGAQCVAIAIRMIQFIDSHVKAADQGISVLPAHWYNIFYVYTALIVLLAARLQPKIMLAVEEAELTAAWNQGSELLCSYESISSSARKCGSVLQMMGSRVGMAATPSSQKDISEDILLSLLYDTTGPLGGPFFYNSGG